MLSFFFLSFSLSLSHILSFFLYLFPSSSVYSFLSFFLTLYPSSFLSFFSFYYFYLLSVQWEKFFLWRRWRINPKLIGPKVGWNEWWQFHVRIFVLNEYKNDVYWMNIKPMCTKSILNRCHYKICLQNKFHFILKYDYQRMLGTASNYPICTSTK
jgi:hypothetical protein